MAEGQLARHPPLSTGRHLYPGLVVAQFLHGFEDFVSGFYERFPLLSLQPEFFVMLYVAALLLMTAMIPSVAHGRRWALRVARLLAVAAVLSGAGHLAISADRVELLSGYVDGSHARLLRFRPRAQPARLILYV